PGERDFLPRSRTADHRIVCPYRRVGANGNSERLKLRQILKRWHDCRIHRGYLEGATLSIALGHTARHEDAERFAGPNTGRSYPLGATLVPGGANFSVFSRSAASVELLFFDQVDDARPSRVIPIDPLTNRTYHYWH